MSSSINNQVLVYNISGCHGTPWGVPWDPWGVPWVPHGYRIPKPPGPQGTPEPLGPMGLIGPQGLMAPQGTQGSGSMAWMRRSR